jgi:hypothetical protein
MMAALESTAPAGVVNLHRHNLYPLVDELGDVLAEKRALELREKTLKAELIALGVDELIGTRWRARVTKSVRATMDQAKARELLGDLADRCLKFAQVESVRVDAIGGRS